MDTFFLGILCKLLRILISLILPLDCRPIEAYSSLLVLADYGYVSLLRWNCRSWWGYSYRCTYLQLSQKHQWIGSWRSQVFLRGGTYIIMHRSRIHHLIFHRVWINRWKVGWCIKRSNLLLLNLSNYWLIKAHMGRNETRFSAKSALSTVESIARFLLDFLLGNLLGKQRQIIFVIVAIISFKNLFFIAHRKVVRYAI